MIKKRLNVRKWLNSVTSADLGAVQVEAFVDSDSEDDPHKCWNAEIDITDCFRTVRLDFCYYNYGGWKNRRRKLRILIDALLALDAWMAENEPRRRKK